VLDDVYFVVELGGYRPGDMGLSILIWA